VTAVSAVTDAVGVVAGAVQTAIGTIVDGVSAAADAIAGGLQAAWDAVVGFFSKPVRLRSASDRDRRPRRRPTHPGRTHLTVPTRTATQPAADP